MISFIWDSGWETIPTDQIPRGDIRHVIGQTAQGTRERMEIEHEWGPNSALDDGSHKLGATGITGRGATVPISNLKSGELYVVDSGGDTQVWLYGDIGSGVQWNLVATLDHAQLANRNVGDPHPIYLKKAGDDIRPNKLKMGGKILRMSGAVSAGQQTFGNLLLLSHAYSSHPSLGDMSAISNGVILGRKISTVLNYMSGNIPNGTYISLVYTTNAFFPEMIVKTAGAAPNFAIRFMGGANGAPSGFVNLSGGTVPYQIRIRTVLGVL